MTKRQMVCDFETITDKTEYFKKYHKTKVISWGTLDLFNDDANVTYLENTSMDSFMDHIFSQKQHLTLWFHHLTFDGEFILEWWVKKHSINSIHSTPLRKRQAGLYIFKSGSKIYYMELGKWVTSKKYVKIKIQCSYLILSSGVESLGESFGMRKHNEEDGDDFYIVEPFEMSDIPNSPRLIRFMEYMFNDILIVKKALLKFNEEIINLRIKRNSRSYFTGLSKLTAGSLTYSLMQNFVKAEFDNDEDIKETFSTGREIHKLGGLIFRGGLSQFNPLIQGIKKHIKNGKGVDVNSMYPRFMTNKLPLTNTKRQVQTIRDKNKYCYIVEIRASSVIPKYDHIYFLPKMKSDRKSITRYLNKSDGLYKNWFIIEEFETLQKYYEFKDLKYITIFEFDAKPFLATYIEKIYAMKEQASRDKDKAKALTYKILLNACYGKFATREKFEKFTYSNTLMQGQTTYLPNKSGTDVIEYLVLGESKNNILNDGTNELKCWRLMEVEESTKLFNKVIAGFITGYSRSFLMESLILLDPNKFLYCDTDSLYVENADLTKLEIDKYKLGAWNIEDEFDEIGVRGAKAYYIKSKGEFVKSKLSGVNSKYVSKYRNEEMWLNDDLLENSKLVRKKVSGGIILLEADYKPTQRRL